MHCSMMIASIMVVVFRDIEIRRHHINRMEVGAPRLVEEVISKPGNIPKECDDAQCPDGDPTDDEQNVFHDS